MYYFSLAKRPALKEAFSDLNNDSGIKVFDVPYKINNKILEFLFRVHMSKKLNDHFYLPFKKIWKKSYCIENEMIDWKQDNFLIIIDSSLVWYSSGYLNQLKKKGIKLIFLAFNPMHQLIENRTFWNVFSKIKFDLLFSVFDIRDPYDFSTIQTYSVYSKCSIPKKSNTFDIVFLGMDKGRHKRIVDIYNHAINLGFKMDVSIIHYNGPEDEKHPEIDYCDEVPYMDYLEKIVNSKCILEIVQDDQKGVTLRTFEAIVYGKYLITNNQFIKEMPFYNPNYIHFYKTIGDIDLNFLREDIVVDYKYDGSFSPLNLIDEITEKLNK